MAGRRRAQLPSRRYLIYLIALFLWFSMIVTAPLLASTKGLGPLSGPIYFIFSWVCHQNPERSLTIRGSPLAVCARCTFLYLGVLVASLLYPVIGSPPVPKARFLFIAALPLVIDGGTQLVGIRSSTNFLRALTGFLFGLALAFYVAPDAESAVSSLLEGRTKGATPSLCS